MVVPTLSEWLEKCPSQLAPSSTISTDGEIFSPSSRSFTWKSNASGWAGRRRSEVDLGPKPEQVVRLLEATRAGEDGAAEDGALPVEVDLDELVEIPVDTDVH